MQLHLNKKLERWELVHHKDNNRENDSIENLEILNYHERSSKYHDKLKQKKPKGWKPANTIKPEVIERAQEIAKEMVKINYSELSRRLEREEIKVTSFTLKKYIEGD